MKVNQHLQNAYHWFSGAPLHIVLILVVALAIQTFGGRAITRAMNRIATADFVPGPTRTVARQKERAQTLGKIMTEALTAMAKKYPVIGEVRGRGAMQAIELIIPGSKEPNSDAMNKVIKYCQQKGVLILSAGTYSNVIRLLPPLVIPENLLREGLSILDEAFASL